MNSPTDSDLSISDIRAKIDGLGARMSPEERAFLAEFQNPFEDPEEFVFQLRYQAADRGSAVEHHTYTFDPEDNPNLAEICPDGEAGFVELLKFFGMYFVHLCIYNEGGEWCGPYASLERAKTSFQFVISQNDPS